MSLRVRVLVGGVLLVVFAILALGLWTAENQQQALEGEAEERARTLLAALAVPCVSALAENRIEDLDQVIEEFRQRMSDRAGVLSVAVLDHGRRVVGHSDKAMYGHILADPFTVRAATSPDSVMRVDEEGSSRGMVLSMPVVTSLAELPGIRWGTLIARIDLGRADALRRTALMRTLMLAALFALLTALLVVVGLQRAILKPLSRLLDAAEALRRGKLDARTGMQGRDELARLGQTFDGMADELAAYTGGLERLVEERTRELDGANQELRKTMSQLREANVQLEELARTDALTGLSNKRHLQESLDFHFALARRGQRALSFAMIDVDHFKHYNDTNGHPEGDRVLRQVAQILRERVRHTDVVCRYGGEEFAIMLPDTPLLRATEVAEELRHRIALYLFPHQEKQPGGVLTVSVGVATLSPDVETPGQLVARADEALYDAKHAGRNQVVAWHQT